MNKKKILTGLAIWAASAAIILIAFFTMAKDYSKLRYIGLTFLLLSTAIALCAFLFLDALGKKSERVMLHAGAFSALGIYVAATFIITLPFMIANKNLNWMAMLDSVVLLLFIMVFIALLYFANSMGIKNREVLLAVGENKRIETTVLTLKNDPKNSACAAKLNKLYEAVKYCDNSVVTQTDKSIEEMLFKLHSALESGERSRADELIDGMLLLYKTRAEEAKNSKGGGF